MRATATVATVKAEFEGSGAGLCSEDGQDGALAIDSKGRVGTLMSWGAGTHIDALRLLAKLVSREMPRQQT